MDFRKCFVTSCKNTNFNSKKIFIAVPSNGTIRKNWCLAVGRRNILSSTSRIYCCEDHFNMEQDCENWIKFKLMNCSIRMKKDAVPHLNLYVQKPLNEKQLQCLPAKKKQKSEFLEPNLQVITETPFSNIQQSHKAVQVHIKAVMEDKGIQVEVKKKTRSSGVNTISVTTSVATSPLKLPHEVPSGKSSSPLISITSSSSTQSHVTSDYEVEESMDP